jgi:hypothetical protein
MEKCLMTIKTSNPTASGLLPEEQNATGGAIPGIEETKAIAEEGLVYGLPIVMNYAVMYEYAVDKNSGQFKAPFNQINNEARVFTYKDTAIVTPNSDTPYSLLWLDLPAEPIVLSVPAVEKSRYYAVQLEDGNTFNYGYMAAVPPEVMPVPTWWPDPIGKAKRPPASKMYFAPPHNSHWRATAPNSSIRGTCPM